MDALSLFVRKLWFLFRRRELDRDLAEEMQFHREQAQAALRSRGLAHGDARRMATWEFGNARSLREEAVDVVRFRFESVWHDVRYAARQLRRSPGFSTTAILVLALGIGATTAIFSAVNPILFSPLPYPHPRAMTMLWERGADGAQRFPNFADYRGIRENGHSLEAIAAISVSIVACWVPAWRAAHVDPAITLRAE